RVIGFSFFIYAIAFISAVILRDWLLSLVSAAVLFWMLRMLFRRTVAAAVVSIKLSIFFFSLILCFKFPLYFLLMVAVFLLTRFYYRKRFQFDYPNFRGD
ncbi:MAG: hypothetical protein WAN36_10865, partial [Calditrichia bacterium]